MKIMFVATCLAVLAGSGPLLAQPAQPGRSDASPPPTLRGGRAPTPNAKSSDAQMEAERLNSEARLKRREDQARRTLQGICRGC